MEKTDPEIERIARNLIRRGYSEPSPFECILYREYDENFIKTIRDKAFEHAYIEREVQGYDLSTFKVRGAQIKDEYVRALRHLTTLRRDESLLKDLPTDEQIRAQIKKDKTLLTKVSDMIRANTRKRYAEKDEEEEYDDGPIAA
ncbi:MAG: hypothetical protein WCK90_03765 [archaeon]